MSTQTLSRALPMSKPTGPEIFEVRKGANVWPEFRFTPQDHREDLETVLRRRGRLPHEFYVSDTPSYIGQPRLGPGVVISGVLENEVVVRFRATGKARADIVRGAGIQNGPLVDWVARFERDLDDG